METKRKYEKANIQELQIEPCGLLCGSVDVTQKEFTVKTDDYELESNSWCDGTFTFD